MYILPPLRHSALAGSGVAADRCRMKHNKVLYQGLCFGAWHSRKRISNCNYSANIFHYQRQWGIFCADAFVAFHGTAPAFQAAVSGASQGARRCPLIARCFLLYEFMIFKFSKSLKSGGRGVSRTHSRQKRKVIVCFACASCRPCALLQGCYFSGC